MTYQIYLTTLYFYEQAEKNNIKLDLENYILVFLLINYFYNFQYISLANYICTRH